MVLDLLKGGPLDEGLVPSINELLGLISICRNEHLAGIGGVAEHAAEIALAQAEVLESWVFEKLILGQVASGILFKQFRHELGAYGVRLDQWLSLFVSGVEVSFGCLVVVAAILEALPHSDDDPVGLDPVLTFRHRKRENLGEELVGIFGINWVGGGIDLNPEFVKCLNHAQSFEQVSGKSVPLGHENEVYFLAVSGNEIKKSVEFGAVEILCRVVLLEFSEYSDLIRLAESPESALLSVQAVTEILLVSGAHPSV